MAVGDRGWAAVVCLRLGVGRRLARSLNKMASSGRSLDYLRLKRTRKSHRVLNDHEVLRLLRTAVEREGSQSAFAKHYRLQRTELNAILNGRKPVTASFAKAVGLRIQRIYVAEKSLDP